MRAWWSCARRGWLGTHGQVLSVVPEPRGENTATVTFSYTDFSCDVTLLPAQLVLPYGSTLVELPDCRWCVSHVPYGSYIMVLMRSTSRLAAFVTMAVNGPSQQCRRLGAIEDLHPVYDDIGAECLRFDWSSAGAGFPYGYKYTLSALGASDTELPMSSGDLAGDVTSIRFDAVALVPSQVYRFSLQGVCSRSGTQTSGAVTTVAITAPPPALGPGVLVDSIADGEGSVLVTLHYADYYCVENVRLMVDGVAPSSQMPPFFVFDSLPRSQGTVYVQITGDVVSGDTASPPCTCMPSTSLSTTVPLYLPALSRTSCSDIEIPTLSVTATSATCLSFAWERKEELLSYSYELATFPDGPIVASASIAQPALDFNDMIRATIPGLRPLTAYVMTVHGRCRNGEPTGSYAQLTAETSATDVAVLPEIRETPSFVRQTLGVYNMHLRYSGYSCVGQPTLVAKVKGAQTPLATNSPVPDQWVIHAVPANVTLDCYFQSVAVAGACTGDCHNDTGADVLRTPTVSFTSPSGTRAGVLECPAPEVSITLQNASCLIISSTSTTADYINAQFSIYAEGNLSPVAQGFVQLPFSYTFNRGTTNTKYTVYLQATCTSTGQQVTGIQTILTEQPITAYLDPIPDQSANFTKSPDPDTLMFYFTYPLSGMHCCQPQDVTLQATGYFVGVGQPSQVLANYVWPVSQCPPGRELQFLLFGRASPDCGCVQPPRSNPVSTQTLTITAPSLEATLSTPAPSEELTMDQAYTVAITNYGGPPPVLQGIGQLAGLNPTDPSLAGAGDASVLGSYMNQWLLHDKYAWNIVMNFIKYNSQRLFTFNLAPYLVPRQEKYDRSYYFTVSAVYYGIAGDPCSGGASQPVQHGTYYIAKRAYAFCDSTLGAVPTPNPDVINPGTFRNFSFPPMLAFFVRLITYNWNVAKGCEGYTNNAAQIQLALTCYGSKKAQETKNEQWWFNATFDGNGYITTTVPSNPVGEASIINGVDFDGNDGYDASDYTAGWNCMERWFMYAAYCNQQLRILIMNGQIEAEDGSTMHLDDIGNGVGQVAPECCQISAITTDGEGNGFPNTTDWLYEKPSPNPKKYTATLAQQQACNAAITALWDKWLNQKTAGNPTGWPADSTNLFHYRPQAWQTTNLFAPHSRPSATMPTTAFNLPCAFSCTTTSLIPGMGYANLGGINFNAINAVFPEIYDTSDASPFSFIGAGKGGVSFNVNSSKTGIAMQQAAFPTISTDPCAQDPLNFLALGFGVWDNLVGPGTKGESYVAQTCGSSLHDEPGGITAFNDYTVAATPLMQTSVCTPWAYKS
jgi:hypothetical protein